MFERWRASGQGDTWFDRAKTHPDDDEMGEDISFCARAGRMGIPVYVHTGVRTNHLKSVHVDEQLYAGQRLLLALAERDALEDRNA